MLAEHTNILSQIMMLGKKCTAVEREIEDEIAGARKCVNVGRN